MNCVCEVDKVHSLEQRKGPSCGCVGVIYFLPVSISKKRALKKINRRPFFQRCIFPLKYQDSDPFTGRVTLIQLYAEPCWPHAQRQLHYRENGAEWEKSMWLRIRIGTMPYSIY